MGRLFSLIFLFHRWAVKFFPVCSSFNLLFPPFLRSAASFSPISWQSSGPPFPASLQNHHWRYQGIPELFGQASAYTMLKAKKKASSSPFWGRWAKMTGWRFQVETRWSFWKSKMKFLEHHPRKIIGWKSPPYFWCTFQTQKLMMHPPKRVWRGSGISKAVKFEIWMFPKIGVPQNGWFIMENPIKMDDLGVPLFLETPISWLWREIFYDLFGGCWLSGLTFLERIGRVSVIHRAVSTSLLCIYIYLYYIYRYRVCIYIYAYTFFQASPRQQVVLQSTLDLDLISLYSMRGFLAPNQIPNQSLCRCMIWLLRIIDSQRFGCGF